MSRWLLLLLLVTACDPVVSERPLGLPFAAQRSHSCTHIGFCFTFMPGFDGKMDGTFKMSPYCPGSQLADYEVQYMEQVLKSGAHRTVERERWLRDIGSCE